MNQAYLYLWLAQVMVAVNITGSKFLLGEFPPLFLLLFRFSTGALILGLLQHAGFSTKFNKRSPITLTATDWLYIIAQALSAGVLFNLLLLAGLHYSSASMAGIITSALPAMVAVLSMILLRERISSRMGLGIFFSILGLIIVNSHNLETANLSGLLGDGLILLALVPEALYYVLAKMHHSPLNVFKSSAIMNTINALICLVLVCLFHSWPTQAIHMPEAICLILVGASSGFFYVFWSLGAKHVPGTTAGLFTALMPINTLILALLFLGEKISFNQSIGMTLVILAIIISTRKPKILV
jgi:drug/metabolite transporter (DMT)-like permease